VIAINNKSQHQVFLHA